MTRRTNGRTSIRAGRLSAAAAGTVCTALLASGCVSFGSITTSLSPGTFRITSALCATGSNGCNAFPDDVAPTTGIRQILVALQAPATVVVSPDITSVPALTFSPSPDYAAELQRLSPARSGARWSGWISAPFSYTTDPATPQEVRSTITVTFPPGPDGAPASIDGPGLSLAVGARNITPGGPANRPVTCGASLTTFNVDVPDAGDGNGPAATLCEDARRSATLVGFDYGVVTSGARSSAPAGTVASMPFVLRNSGFTPERFGPATIRAATTLPGATVVPVPGTLAPGKNEDASALVAVGIPAGTAPGVYDVTLTATLNEGTVRTGVGTLTVLAPPPGTGTGGGGGTITARRLTTVLPKGLRVARARADGLPVLLGSTVAGPALVRLQQGPKKRPTVSIGKRIRLKAPGPVKVTFRSRKLAKGPYRISISVAGKVVKTAGGRLVK